MSLLDLFALFVLLVLLLTLLGSMVLLGWLPGKIARDRKHPQAAAISVCGWWGLLTLGVLLPLAFVWAYTNPQTTLTGRTHPDNPSGEDKL